MPELTAFQELAAVATQRTVTLSPSSVAVLRSAIAGISGYSNWQGAAGVLTEAERDYIDGVVDLAAYEINAESEAGVTIESAVLWDKKASGTHGGGSVANAWTQRVLNEIGITAPFLLELSGNEFRLAVGTYLVNVEVPHVAGGATGTRVRYRIARTGTSLIISPTLMYNADINVGSVVSFAGVLFVTSEAAWHALEYYSTDARALTGLGWAIAVSGEFEFYSRVTLTKIA